MKSLKTKRKLKKLNNKGQLTIEFMFALILIVSVSVLLGVLTFTLTLTEVLQYVTYAGARSYFAADMSTDDQTQAGNNKANSLLHSLPFLTGAEANKWITVKATGAQQYAGYRDSIGAPQNRNQFEGYQLQVTVPILNVQIPFIKDVVRPPDGQQDFQTTLSSFLTREPTFNECQSYLSGVFDALKQTGGYGSLTAAQAPIVIIDNGC